MRQLLFNFEEYIFGLKSDYISSLENTPVKLVFNHLKNRSFFEFKNTNSMKFVITDAEYDFYDRIFYKIICFNGLKEMLCLLEQNEFNLILLKECKHEI